jgi:hypothetical protein
MEEKSAHKRRHNEENNDKKDWFRHGSNNTASSGHTGVPVSYFEEN